MIYIAPILKVESEALALLGGEHD